MTHPEDLLRAAGRGSTPEPERVAALQQRIADDLTREHAAKQLLSQLDAPTDAAVARIRQRVHAGQRRVRPALLIAPAMAAMAALFLGWWLQAPRVLDTALGDHTLAVSLTPAITLDVRGTGHAAGTERAPRIQWKRGTLRLDVDPQAHVDVEVHTPEAIVRVVGTVFDVTRDPLGTRVDVTRGAVAVQCAGRDDVLLHADESHTCWPRTSAALLGRARALEAHEASVDDVLATLDLALQLPAAAAVHGEVLAHRVRAQRDAGRVDAAIADAHRYLDDGHTTRRDEMTALIEALTE